MKSGSQSQQRTVSRTAQMQPAARRQARKSDAQPSPGLLDTSPRLVAQRQRLDSAFGPAIQRQPNEEEEGPATDPAGDLLEAVEFIHAQQQQAGAAEAEAETPPDVQAPPTYDEAMADQPPNYEEAVANQPPSYEQATRRDEDES